VFALFAAHALAQGYPNKPVRVIISFTPASATDIVGRIVGAKLSEYWGQPVVAENRSGAGGSLGSNVVAQAAPDGFGLWFGLWGPAGLPAELVNKISTDTRRALADPGVLEKLRNTGNSPMDMSPQEFAKLVRSEIDDYARTARAAGIKPQ
jgi:tripartite-type tricarboxylate transporter receptor subunit TctC